MELTREETELALMLTNGWRPVTLADMQRVIQFAGRLQQSFNAPAPTAKPTDGVPAAIEARK